jgi:hypothetical protein
MSRLIGEHYEGDVRVRFHQAGDELVVERHQDAQAAVDLVATINADGAPTIDGLGKPVGELPYVVWIDWCQRRGLDWEKLFKSAELDGEYKRCVAEHSKLRYQSAKTVHGVI